MLRPSRGIVLIHSGLGLASRSGRGCHRPGVACELSSAQGGKPPVGTRGRDRGGPADDHRHASAAHALRPAHPLRAGGRSPLAPLIPVRDFGGLISWAGGYNELKQLGVGSVLLGQLVTGAVGGMLLRDRFAQAAGARVLHEPRRGNGRACITGSEVAAGDGHLILAFLDGDGSCDAADLPTLVAGLERGDLVLGRRSPRLTERGALPGMPDWATLW